MRRFTTGIYLLVFIGTIIFKTTFAQTYYSWSSFGNGVNGIVYSIGTYQGKTIIAGGFTQAGNVSAKNIAMWNDSGWVPLGTGVGNSNLDTVYAVFQYGSNLYAGGRFSSAGGVQANNIAKWNGSVWTSVSQGTNGDVRTLAVYNNDLIAGGSFTSTGGKETFGIARWNGTYWSALDEGCTGGNSPVVYALTLFNARLVAAGKFQEAGGSNANNIASWNGDYWLPFGSGIGGNGDRVYSLAVNNNVLYAGGSFQVSGSFGIASWNGNSWNGVGGGIEQNKEVLALTSFNNQLIAGGTFNFINGSNLFADRIALWNGTSWARMLTGTNEKVAALIALDTSLYTGGKFTTAGGKFAGRVAKWSNQQVVTISGQVKYADNNQPVLSGKVKILRLDINTREIIVVDSANIINGLFTLPHVLRDSTDRIIGFPNDESDAFVPTYYPSTIDWSASTAVNTYSSQTNINLNVYRLVPGIIPSVNVGGGVFLNYTPPDNSGDNLVTGGFPYWRDAVIYLKQAGIYKKYASSDELQHYSMSNIAPGVYDVVVNRMGYSGASRTIVVGITNLDSVNFYLDTLSVIGLHNISSQVPSGYSLKQNYPNPFNPVTTIGFILKARNFTTMKIFDILGREVMVTVNQVLAAGEYKYTFDAGNLPSGIYFYRLISGDFSETKKMILIK